MYKDNGYDASVYSIGKGIYTLYIADTDARRQQGLSHLTSLRNHEGMLFEMKKKDKHAFWMKDMDFGLDFIYVDGELIVDLKENISPDTFPDHIVSEYASNVIIELNAGEIRKNDIKVGERIKRIIE